RLEKVVVVVAQAGVDRQVLPAQIVLNIARVILAGPLAAEAEERASPRQIERDEVGIVALRLGIVQARIGDAEGEGLADGKALGLHAGLELVVSRELRNRQVRSLILERAVLVRGDRRIVR